MVLCHGVLYLEIIQVLINKKKMSSPGRRTVLSLYRQLMRLHQKLPPDMGAVGQMFIREEFKKHRSASDDIAEKFVKEWRVREQGGERA